MPPAEGPVRGWNPLTQSFYNANDPYGTGIAAPENPIFGSQYGPNQMLDLEDLNLPGLTPSDRQYLAGLARYYNPQSAEALANANAWNAPAAVAPPGAAPAPVAAPAPPWTAPQRAGGYPYGTPTDPNDWRNSWDPIGTLTAQNPFWRMGGAANEYARNQATQEGGGGLGFSGSNAAVAPGYTAPQNYNPQNAAATWGQTENWTPPPQSLSPWGAPPQAAQQATQNPLPQGAPSRARFLRESGIGPRPQAPNLPPQPPGFGTPFEQLERARNPQAWAAWENAAGQRQAQDAAVNDWKAGRDRYMPDYRNQLKTWLGQNAPNWQPTTPAPTPPPQNLTGAAWGQANPYSVPNTRPPSAYDVFGRSA